MKLKKVFKRKNELFDELENILLEKFSNDEDFDLVIEDIEGIIFSKTYFQYDIDVYVEEWILTNEKYQRSSIDET